MVEKMTLARPYVKAIFEMAMEDNALEAWSNMLSTLAFIAEDEQVKKILNDPTHAVKDNETLFLSICAKILNDYGKNLLHTLAQRKRLNILPEIFSLFEEKRQEAENVLTVDFASKIPLTKKQHEGFVKKLEKQFGRHIDMQCRIESDLLGGFLIKAGDVVIDGSVRGQLLNLKEMMGG
jgi:F-type H+-transporting ATPase subunit delta